MHTLHRSKFTSASSGFPATARLSCLNFLRLTGFSHFAQSVTAPTDIVLNMIFFRGVVGLRNERLNRSWELGIFSGSKYASKSFSAGPRTDMLSQYIPKPNPFVSATSTYPATCIPVGHCFTACHAPFAFHLVTPLRRFVALQCRSHI